jgi:hypothetical protein
MTVFVEQFPPSSLMVDLRQTAACRQQETSLDLP